MKKTMLTILACVGLAFTAAAQDYDVVIRKPNQPAVGVETVLVNGVITVRDGKLVLDAVGGRPIRRAVAK